MLSLVQQLSASPEGRIVAATPEFRTSREVVSLSAPPIGSLWSLPSDHLPLAARVGDITLGSWNVLNSAYVRNLKNSSRGLADSVLVEDHRPYEKYEAITVREHKVLSTLISSLRHFDVLFLQECGPRFIDALRTRCPSNWQLIAGRSSASMNDLCVLLNTEAVSIDFDRSELIENAFPRCRKLDPVLQRPIMNLALKSLGGASVQVVHTHVPGHPEFPGVLDLAEYVDPFAAETKAPLIVLGDLNFSEGFVRDIFYRVGMPSVHNVVPLNTVLGDYGVAKQIDFILQVGGHGECVAAPLELFGAAAAETAALLNRERGLS